MRLAILQKKAQIMGVALSDDIMNFLANRIRTNVRRLEGALIRVASSPRSPARTSPLKSLKACCVKSCTKKAVFPSISRSFRRRSRNILTFAWPT